MTIEFDDTSTPTRATRQKTLVTLASDEYGDSVGLSSDDLYPEGLPDRWPILSDGA